MTIKTSTAPQTPVTVVNGMTLEHGQDGQVVVTFGDRSYQVEESIFATLVDDAVSIYRREMDEAVHAPWCDLPTHAREQADSLHEVNGPVGCIGRYHELLIDGADFSGWWHEDDDDGEPIFTVHSLPGDHRVLTLANLKDLRRVLAVAGDHPHALTLLQGVDQVIADVEQGIPAGVK